MSAYKLTGYHSHRHPFLGVEESASWPAIAPADDVFEALAADEPARPGLSLAKIARPLVSGAVAGLVTYTTCRAFAVDKKKASQVAFVLAGINVIVGLASDWIFNEMQSLVSTSGTVSATEVKP